MSNQWLNQTGIGYGVTDDIKAVLIGLTSNFEMELEQSKFEGINKACKLFDLPTIKINFFDLSDSLITFLKASVNHANGVKFWNKTGLYDGIYQSHYYQDEFKQQAILTLYQKTPVVHNNDWAGNPVEIGETGKFYFGKGNFKIGSLELPASRAMIEKNINTEVERFKISGGYKYFFKDTVNFKIVLHEPSAAEMAQIVQIKDSMVDFTPHIDRPEIIYRNFFAEYKYLETGRDIKSVEINISQVV